MMMSGGYKNRSEHLIYQRRAEQERLDNLNGKLKQQFYHKQFAKWENRGAGVQKATEMKRRLQELREYSRRQLNQRKQKLSILLEGQNQKYQKQIIDSQETPEQVRARMAERVRQLKQERQNQKKIYVDQQYERRFEMNADELRKVDAQLKELRTDLDRNVQLIQKQAVMENKYQEQILFAQLNRRQLKKKQQIEKQKVRQARQKIEERNAILGLQKQMKQQKAMKDKQLHELEKQMLKDEWARQKETIKERDAEALLRQRDATKQLLESNEIQRKMKQLQARRQRQLDKQMLQQVLERERQQAEAQKQQRLREKQEAKKVLTGMRIKGQQALAQQKQLQRLIQQQRLKRQAKQYEQWRKNQQARINLLKDVYKDRQRKVHENLNMKDQQRRLKQLDKQNIDQSLQRFNQQQEQKKNLQLIRNKQQQQRLLEQIRLKQEKRRLLLLELEKEQSEISKARKDYDKKIQQRKEKGKQELDQFKRTNRLF